jgi:hypothetical protein
MGESLLQALGFGERLRAALDSCLQGPSQLSAGSLTSKIFIPWRPQPIPCQPVNLRGHRSTARAFVSSAGPQKTQNVKTGTALPINLLHPANLGTHRWTSPWVSQFDAGG